MNIDNTKKLKKTKDYFDDNFEVIYQEDKFSALLKEEMAKNKAKKEDGYKDVLASLSEIDHTDYIQKNKTGRYRFMTRKSASTSVPADIKKSAAEGKDSTTEKSTAHTTKNIAISGKHSTTSKNNASSLILTIRRAPRKFIRKMRNSTSSKSNTP